MIRQVTAPVALALSWDAEVKPHLRLDSDDERMLIESVFIPAADQVARQETGLSLINRTLRLTIDAPPLDGQQLELPAPPLWSIESVKYIDEGGVQRTWAAEHYVVMGAAGVTGADLPPDDGPPSPGRLYPGYDQVWPTVRISCPAMGLAQLSDAFEVIFKSGYGETPSAIPGLLRAAMLLVIGEMFAHREDTITGTIIAPLPRAASDIFRKYRVPKFREGWAI